MHKWIFKEVPDGPLEVCIYLMGCQLAQRWPEQIRHAFSSCLQLETALPSKFQSHLQTNAQLTSPAYSSAHHDIPLHNGTSKFQGQLSNTRRH